MKIIYFCNNHYACAEGRKWALAQSVETMAELWELPMRSEWRIWIATRDGVLTPQEYVMWACRCVRRIWHRLDDDRSRTAVEVAERWSRGEASDEELATSAHAAHAARAAVTASAYAAASAAANASIAAYASIAASAAAASACAAAAYSSERDWQAEELVNTFGNPFRKET